MRRFKFEVTSQLLERENIYSFYEKLENKTPEKEKMI